MSRLCCGFLSLAVCVYAAPLAAAADASHKQSRTIDVPGHDGSSLQTFTLLPDGKVAALVASGGSHGEPGEVKAAPASEVHVFDAAGEPAEVWKIDFAAQSIAAGPDGNVFVGGDGRLVKLDGTGHELSRIELPHLKEAIADTEKLRERATALQKQYEESQAQFAAQFDEQKKEIQEKLDELKAKEESELTAAEKRRMQRFEVQLREFETVRVRIQVPSVDDLMKQLTDRLRLINGVTVTDQDVFVVTGESTGFGYSVWRMDHAFQGSKQVLSELRGCCGQMDVRASGNELFVAENCSHRVGRYTRDGEKIKDIGERSERRNSGAIGLDVGDAEDSGFGGCCNPMNLCVGKDGLIYTAESEGIIRCFSSGGEYRGLVGSTTLSGGCKNVAVAVSSDGNTVYFCDKPGQRIIVLSRNDAVAEKTE
ncbi:MAG: hypothetical protein U0992_05730 [Planctomycetaceae bacterium]